MDEAQATEDLGRDDHSNTPGQPEHKEHRRGVQRPPDNRPGDQAWELPERLASWAHGEET